MQKIEKEKEEVISTETICALATSHSGVGAVAIVRISGPQAFPIVENFARKMDGAPLTLKGSHRCRYGLFCERNGVPVDSVLYVYMRGPKSFTGEDVVEIQCHGGLVQPRIIIECITTAGARLARCGVFSQRAFLNGRLSLLEAEAVNNMVSATTRAGAKAALNNSLGLSTTFVNELRASVLSVLAQVEAQIDFPEDVEHLDDNTSDLITAVEKVSDSLRTWLTSFHRGIILQNGLSLVITGPANSGKSSLFNCLVQSDRAIVNSIAGTTRDTISESISIDGWNFNIHDTAGLRKTNCSIEKEGIERSKSAVDSADIVLSLYDASAGHSTDVSSEQELSENQIVLTVGNKLDLLPEDYRKNEEHVYISARNKTGLSELVERLVRAAKTLAEVNDSEGVVMASLRQKGDTLEAVGHLDDARTALTLGAVDQAADDLRYASKTLGTLVGEIHSEDVVNEIFSAFCLGK